MLIYDPFINSDKICTFTSYRTGNMKGIKRFYPFGFKIAHFFKDFRRLGHIDFGNATPMPYFFAALFMWILTIFKGKDIRPNKVKFAFSDSILDFKLHLSFKPNP